MKSVIKFTCLIFSISLLFNAKGISQNTEQKELSDIVLIKAAREIMIDAGTCALITLDEKGRPRVRVMDPFIPESDLVVWFGTNPKSRKVNQIQKDPRVTLYYIDSDASGYVMIHGIAQIVNDQKEKEKRWKDDWKGFYPNRPDGYLLIKVVPKWMEVISYTYDILGDSISWQPPFVLFDSIQ